MKKLYWLLSFLLVCTSAQAASKSCPGTVYFTDGRTMECISITIPGWIDAEVSVTTLTEGKKQAFKIKAGEIARLELWDGKNPDTKTDMYGVPFIKEKGRKRIPAARWMTPESEGEHVRYFTRYQMYKMSGKGLVGIVNGKINATEPEAFFWRPGEEKPVYLGEYMWFQYSDRKMKELIEKHFADDPVLLEQIHKRRWLNKENGGVFGLFAYVTEHYNPQRK